MERRAFAGGVLRALAGAARFMENACRGRTAPKIREIDHVVLRCRDQARMIDFYTRVIGLVEERRLDQIGLVQLRAGASLIDLVPSSEARIESGLNVDHFCLGAEIASSARQSATCAITGSKSSASRPFGTARAGRAFRFICAIPKAT